MDVEGDEKKEKKVGIGRVRLMDEIEKEEEKSERKRERVRVLIVGPQASNPLQSVITNSLR